MVDIMFPCVQQWTVSDHSAQRDPKADFEPIVGHLLCGTVADIGDAAKTFEPKTSSESPDGVRQSIDDLQGSLILSTLAHDVLPNPVLDLMQIDSLAHEQSAFCQLWEEGTVVGGEVGEDVTVRVEFEEFAADFDGDNFSIGEFGGNLPFLTVLWHHLRFVLSGCDPVHRLRGSRWQ